MALQASAIADLVTTTQRDLGKLKWTDIASSLQKYIAMPKLLKEKKVSFSDGGYEIQWNVMVTQNNAAQNVGLFAEDNTNIGDVMKTASIPWRHTVSSYGYDVREPKMNSGAARIVDLIKTRRVEAMYGMAERMETDFWGKPTDSTDTTTPFGLKYWIVMGNTTPGFSGGDPSGFSAGAAGLASATYTRWQNYCGGYTSVTKPDLIAKWRKASTFTDFTPPTEVPQYASDSQYGYYTNYAVIGALETLLESQNDNLGNDVASKDGHAMFRKVAVTWAPKLEDNSNNPIYGIDWSNFRPVFIKDTYMKESEPIRDPGAHNVYNIFTDCSYNWQCLNRRTNFVLATATF